MYILIGFFIFLNIEFGKKIVHINYLFISFISEVVEHMH